MIIVALIVKALFTTKMDKFISKKEVGIKLKHCLHSVQATKTSLKSFAKLTKTKVQQF